MEVFRTFISFSKQVHLYNLNTRIVLIMTAILLVALGTLAMLFTSGTMHFLAWKLQNYMLFNATCPRVRLDLSVSGWLRCLQTFVADDYTRWHRRVRSLTAGWVKINVCLHVILLNLWAVIRGANRVTIFPERVVRTIRSAAKCSAYVVSYHSVCCNFCHEHVRAQSISNGTYFWMCIGFEYCGFSLDLTPVLSTAGKSVIILLMFIGRVGAFTLLLGLIKQVKSVIINIKW